MGVVAILFLIMSIVFHELGHAFAMYRYGIEMKEVSIFGIGGKPLITFKHPRFLGGVPVVIRPIPLGAAVTPTKMGSGRMLYLNYLSFGHIVGGGICANMLFAAILGLVGILIDPVPTNIIYIYFIIAGFLIGVFPRYAFNLIIPLGIYVAYVVIGDFVKTPAASVHNAGSVVTIGKQMVQESSTWAKTFFIGAKISVAVGIMNCLPLIPLDGGRLMLYLLERCSWKNRRIIRLIYGGITLIPLLILVFISFGNDLILIFKSIF